MTATQKILVKKFIRDLNVDDWNVILIDNISRSKDLKRLKKRILNPANCISKSFKKHQHQIDPELILAFKLS